MGFKTEATLEWNGDEVKAISDIIIKDAPYESAINMQGLAVDFCIVDKGGLRNSITARDDTRIKTEGQTDPQNLIKKPNEKGTALMGTNMPYASWIEFGRRNDSRYGEVTVKKGAQPFIRPALDLGKGEVLRIFTFKSRKEFEKYFREDD